MTREEEIRAESLRKCLGSSPTAERKRRKWIEGAMWADSHPANLWKDAQGADLPEYDREVVVLIQATKGAPEYLEVSFAHRPNPKGYVIVKGEQLFAKTYGKGEWNLPNIKYWLDLDLPL